MTGIMPSLDGSVTEDPEVKNELKTDMGVDKEMEVISGMADDLESITSNQDQTVNTTIPTPDQITDPLSVNDNDTAVLPELEPAVQAQAETETKPEVPLEPKIALALEESGENLNGDEAPVPLPNTAFEAVDEIDAEVIADHGNEDESEVKPEVPVEAPVHDPPPVEEVTVKEEIPVEESRAEYAPLETGTDSMGETAPADAVDGSTSGETDGAGIGAGLEIRTGNGNADTAEGHMVGQEPPTPTSLPAEAESSDTTSTTTPTSRRKARNPSKSTTKSKANTPSRSSATKGKGKGKGKGRSKDPIVIPDSDSDLEPEQDPEDLLDTSPPETAILSPHGFQEIETPINNHYLYVFFRFCAERHRMTVKREDEGVARDALTEDECMYKERVGNIFRELDPGSKRIKDVIMGVGDQSYEEVCFRVLLNAGFYVPETFQALQDGLGEVPNWKNFNLDKYEAILYERSVIQKKVIYTSAFQLVPPTVYFGRNLPHFAATLRFVKALMESGLPQKLRQCKYAVDASHILQTFPSLGGFLAQNILVSMNDSIEFMFHYRNFATCGPGSRAYLQRIFGKQTINHVAMEQAGLRWLYENQWRYWARLGEDPPHAWKLEKGMRPGMRVLDFENALCWAHRYVNAYQRKGFGSFADIPSPDYDVEKTETASMPAWCDDPHQINSPNRASFMGDYEEEAQKLAEEEGEEGVYEIEKIICRKGHRTDKNGLFRVRWKGYPPEDDTWERASTLEEGAEEALKEWLEWEESVWGTIARITKEDPYTRPWPGVKAEPKEEVDEKPDTAAGTRGKRGRQSTGTAGPSQRPKRTRGEQVKVEA